MLNRIRNLSTTIPFRAVVAAIFLVAHLYAVVAIGHSKFDLPFNAAPQSAPVVTGDWISNWGRLLVSRWDAEHYIGVALRGYSKCPAHPKADELFTPYYIRQCALPFYPGYGLIGRLSTFGGRIAIDYAMLGCSILASFIFLFLFTDRAITSRLGVGPTYLALLLFNAFPTGFSLVTIQTEPSALAFALGAFVALDRKRFLLGALLAGAATGLRVTAAAVGIAFALAVIADVIGERPSSRWEWAKRGLAVAVSGWGVLAMLAYHLFRFGDPLTYVHAHEVSFAHEPSLMSLILPPVAAVKMAINNGLHEGMWLLGACIWLLLGHRRALEGFPRYQQVFWYTLTIVCIGIATLGQIQIGLAGMNRYLILVIPIFFSISKIGWRRPLVLVPWFWACLWHYWNADLCYYVGGPGDEVLKKCGDGQWVDTL
jgi:hypothetical protein